LAFCFLGILGFFILRVVQGIARELKDFRSTLTGGDTPKANQLARIHDELERIGRILQGIRDDLGVSPHRASSSTFGDRVAGISEAVWEMRQAQERDSRE
jgi:hypothetical protein